MDIVSVKSSRLSRREIVVIVLLSPGEPGLARAEGRSNSFLSLHVVVTHIRNVLPLFVFIDYYTTTAELISFEGKKRLTDCWLGWRRSNLNSEQIGGLNAIYFPSFVASEKGLAHCLNFPLFRQIT